MKRVGGGGGERSQEHVGRSKITFVRKQDEHGERVLRFLTKSNFYAAEMFLLLD